MATYAQWREGNGDAGKVKRVTWVCGDQAVLVEEVVDHVRSTVAAHTVDTVSLTAGTDPDREVWAAANQYPMEPGTARLVMVREAQRIRDWRPLEGWMDNGRLLPTSHLLFVSAEPDFAAYPKADKKAPTVLLPHLQWIRDKAMGELIRCACPSDERPARGGPSDLVRWVQRQAPCSIETANHLIERVGGDLRKARNVARKASLFAGDMTKAHVDALCSESPSQDFVESLLRLEKPRALRALEALDPDDLSMTIGSLDWHLEFLGKLHAALRARKDIQEIRRMDGIPRFLINPYLGVAKHYDAPRRQRCRTALALVDAAADRGGPPDGALEALVALW